MTQNIEDYILIQKNIFDIIVDINIYISKIQSLSYDEIKLFQKENFESMLLNLKEYIENYDSWMYIFESKDFDIDRDQCAKQNRYGYVEDNGIMIDDDEDLQEYINLLNLLNKIQTNINNVDESTFKISFEKVIKDINNIEVIIIKKIQDNNVSIPNRLVEQNAYEFAYPEL